MKTFVYGIFSLVVAFSSVGAVAQGFGGAFSVSDVEQKIHRRNIRQFSRVTYRCLEDEFAKHDRFFRTYGFSRYYGDRSTFGKLPWADKQNFLRRMGKDPALLSQMEATSCVGFVMKCFAMGFEATGQADVWQRIRWYAQANNTDGGAIIDALQQLGWYVMYWNPDVSRNAEWDENEKRRNAENSDRFWGYHAYRWATVRSSNRYWKNYVNDAHTLVNFGHKMPRVLRKADLFMGIAHSGYHVFAGSKGHIIEGHSTRPLTDYETIERADFDPLNPRGAPRGQFRSGLIAVPPGEEP